jgi:hypothetical protein
MEICAETYVDVYAARHLLSDFDESWNKSTKIDDKILQKNI